MWSGDDHGQLPTDAVLHALLKVTKISGGAMGMSLAQLYQSINKNHMNSTSDIYGK
jgi:hypothetical protein